KLVLAILSLPFSNESVERMFSIMNIVKDKLRNKMSIKTTETILHLRDNLPDGCINFEPSKEMIRNLIPKICTLRILLKACWKHLRNNEIYDYVYAAQFTPKL
ncbi:hypothetical protein ALC60_11672, partial [Trachymyrmex zeteki]